MTAQFHGAVRAVYVPNQKVFSQRWFLAEILQGICSERK